MRKSRPPIPVISPNERRLKHALYLAEQGALIVPLAEGGKAPINEGGSRNPLRGRKAVKQFFANSPNANYGVCTGREGGRVVLDVDGDEGEATLRSLTKANSALPPTIEVKTKRGRHLYFDPGELTIRNSAGRLGPGLDVRGEGGYAVGPGSAHPSGFNYRYIKGHSPRKTKVAAFPTWLAEKLAPSTSQPKPKAQKSPEIPRSKRKRVLRYAKAAFRLEIERLENAPVHQRNDTLNRCAFQLGQFLAHDLLSLTEVSNQLTAAARLIGLEEREIGPTISSGLAAGQLHPRDLSKILKLPRPNKIADQNVPPETDIAKRLSAYGETDADNARRLVERFGKRLLWTLGGGYFVWTGTHWQRDGAKRRYQLAEETARHIADEATHLDPTGHAERRKFSQRSLSKGALDRMLHLAESLLILPDDKLDANPYQLTTLNGTINLRTGVLEEHDPRDFITRLVPVEFDPKAKCPEWRAFIKFVTGGYRDFRRYLRLAVGYTLTGDMRLQCFFLVIGPGNNGKSVFINTVRALLGSFGQNTPFTTFLARHHDSIPTDLAALRGARMVVAQESNHGQQLDEAKIKAFTGGDPMTARFLHGNFFTYQPAGKLWLVTNDFPQVRSTSHAFWRRPRVIPFEIKIPDDMVVENFHVRLEKEFPGILAWAVRGCRDQLKSGLGSCLAVEKATKRWMDGADHLKRFVAEVLVAEDGAKVSSGAVYDRYLGWCHKNGEVAMSPKAIKARLIGLDFRHKRRSEGSVWLRWRFRRE